MSSNIKLQLSIQPGAIEPQIIIPDTEYKPKEGYLVEGFESSHQFQIDRDGNPETVLVSTTEEFRSGSMSGLMEVSADKPLLEVASSSIFTAEEVQSRPLFLELDYKNEDAF